MAKRVIYLHGFRSSPASFKARMLAPRISALDLQWHCPQLPVSPRAAIELIERDLRPSPGDCLIGSSLGGFYARYLVERHGCDAVLLNPAIAPERDLAKIEIPATQFHSDQPFHWKPDYIGELSALRVPSLMQPARYFLVAAKGDELLDWREMIAAYPNVKTRLIEGSDHGLSDFDRHIDAVVEWAVA